MLTTTVASETRGVTGGKLKAGWVMPDGSLSPVSIRRNKVLQRGMPS